MWETEGVDSKKSPTKCIIHGQAGKFILTVFFFFFLDDRKKNRKKFFYLLFVLKKTVSTSYFPSRIFGRLPNGKYCYAWAIKTPFNMDL